MDIRQVQKIAIELMTQHGLLARGWKFGFDNAKRRLGRCSYRRQRISVSRDYASLNTEELVRDTILHEIAHALTPNAGHGWKWKLCAQRIGARPKSCKDVRDIKFIETDWTGKCSDCGTVSPRYRKPQLDGRRRWHVPCARKANRGTILWFFRGQQHDNFGEPIVELAQAAENAKTETKTELTQPQINELWERLSRLEAKWKNE